MSKVFSSWAEVLEFSFVSLFGIGAFVLFSVWAYFVCRYIAFTELF